MKKERSSRGSDAGVLKGLILGGLIGGLIGALLVASAVWLGPFLIGSDLSENRLIQQLAAADQILTAWDFLALPVLVLIVLATHEVGHLVGGLSQGMRFLLLIVGPFGWHASASGPKFEWNTNVALMGGIAAAVPTRVGADLRRQLLVLVAGGPSASFLLAVLAVAVASVSDPRFAAYCIFAASISLGVFLVTLIPMRSGGFMSDGMQIIDVLRGGSAVAERSALLRIFAQSLDGVRPRDWDKSALDELSKMNSDDPLRGTGGLLYLLYHAMDCRHDLDIARYRQLLEDGVDGYPAGFKQAIYVELAICAWLAGDIEDARQYLKASKGGVVDKSRRLLAHAALAQLEGRHDDCERDRFQVIKALEKAADAGQRKLTEDQLALLARRA